MGNPKSSRQWSAALILILDQRRQRAWAEYQQQKGGRVTPCFLFCHGDIPPKRDSVRSGMTELSEDGLKMCDSTWARLPAAELNPLQTLCLRTSSPLATGKV